MKEAIVNLKNISKRVFLPKINNFDKVIGENYR